MAGVPFAAASSHAFHDAFSGPGAIVATLRFNPVLDEDMLPEARKEIADAMWETVLHNGVDCIFDNKLPAAEEYSYMEVLQEQGTCARRWHRVPTARSASSRGR